MKITKEELTNIIKEEVEKALSEQDFFEPEEEMEIKKTNPGGVDKDGVPLKAPFPPGIKSARELIKKYPPNSDERNDYRKWYNKYGPGSKRKKTAAKPISKGKKLPNVKVPAYDPKKDKFAGSYPEIDTPSGVDPVEHAMDRAYAAEVKGQYRVAKHFFEFACRKGYKSKTSGENTACAKVKEMTAKMNKGMGIQKGSDFDKSKNNPKENPNQKAVSPAIDKKPDNINSKKVVSTTLTKADNDKIKSEFHKKMGATDKGDWFVKNGYLKKVQGGYNMAKDFDHYKKGKREYDRAFNKFKLQYISDNFGTVEVK